MIPAFSLCFWLRESGSAYRVRDTRHWYDAAALGLLFGLGALTKTLILLALPLLALGWWRRIGLRDAARLAVIAGIALAAVIAPWTIRNTRVQGHFVLISTNGGSNLHQGNNPCVADYLGRGWDAQWVGLPGTPACRAERGRAGPLAPPAGDHVFTRASRRVAAPVLDQVLGAVEFGDYALRPAARPVPGG